MKLSDWARANGVHPKTALRWFERGTLPVPARRVGPRTILVEATPGPPGERPWGFGCNERTAASGPRS